ncbi:MAG TPA: F0F1 ATP synthase subunit B [Candidatus Limnocylindrales bacterium]|nr:F0F1 ATP synthase subunit B [Candidatus Limnocylindrales bacterium]
MNTLLLTFAAETEAKASPGLFGALGIDWRMLVLQVLAFAILVWLLSKYVYPPLVKAIDDREKSIERSVAAAHEAEARAAKSQKEISQLLKSARTEADEILARSHAEAAATVAASEEKAKTRAEQIVKDAHLQLESDIAKARAALKHDTAKLVAVATEQIIHEKVDDRKDAQLIERALKREQA